VLDSEQLEFFDTHCHFDFEDFDADREDLWRDCRAKGVRHMLIPGVAPHQWSRMQTLCQPGSGLYFAAGLHPCWLPGNITREPTQLQQLKDALRNQLTASQCIAIGECGLDQYIDGDPALQEAALESHLEVAQECGKPVILHCRRAHNALLRQLKKNPIKQGGIVHAYSGSREQAEQYWELGFYLGIGGTITYERANKTRAAVKELPLEALVLETDAPDMPLCGQQGKRNTPLQIREVARTLAELRNESIELIAQQTTANAKQLFHLAH
jgi:TatD DNase family protein